MQTSFSIYSTSVYGQKLLAGWFESFCSRKCVRALSLPDPFKVKRWSLGAFINTDKRTCAVVTKMRQKTPQLAQLVAERSDSKCLEAPAPLPSGWHHGPHGISYFKGFWLCEVCQWLWSLGTLLNDDKGGFLFFSLSVPGKSLMLSHVTPVCTWRSKNGLSSHFTTCSDQSVTKPYVDKYQQMLWIVYYLVSFQVLKVASNRMTVWLTQC